jgi:hypothetical protein
VYFSLKKESLVKLHFRVITVLSILIPPCSLYAAADGLPHIPNSFNGIPITAETLQELMPPLPEDDQQALDSWLTEPGTDGTLKQLLSFGNFPAWRAKMELDKARLAEEGLINESTWNYVFKLPKQNFVMKIAGPLNRLQSILMAHGFWPGDTPTKPIEKVDTYQTASRAAYYLVLKKWIKENKFKHVQTPDTYLISYPKDQKKIDDEHAFILQKKLPATAQKITPEIAQTLSPDTISEVVQAIISAGLWSIKDNLFLDLESNKPDAVVQFVDLEQPNNSAPQDFFHKDPIRYYGNVRAGLEEFIDLFAGNSEKLSLIRALIESNPVFNSPHFYQRYKHELVNVLNAKAPLPIAPTE